MLAVSALAFALGTLAVLLPGAGGSAATARRPAAALATGARRALAVPARELRPPARLHRRNRRRHLPGAPLRRRLRPPRRLRHRPLRRRAGLGERPHDQHGGRGRDPRPRRARGLLHVGGHRRALPARLPQVRQVRPAPPSQPDRQAVQPPVPERVLAQPQERPRAARLRPAASRGPHRRSAPGPGSTGSSTTSSTPTRRATG